MTKFIPAGQQVVIVRKNGKPTWFKLTKDFDLSNDCPGTAVCPLSRGRVVVNYVERDGFRVLYPETLVKLADDADGIDPEVLANLNPIVFNYYIPTGSKFPNPSGILRRFAFRFDGSAWIMRGSDVPHALIARMIAAGCRPFVAKMDPGEAKKIIGLAIERIGEEAEAQIERAAESQEYADAQLAAAMETEGLSAEQAHTRYESRTAAIAERLESLRGDLLNAAERFGINPNILRLDRLQATRDAVSSAMAARAKIYLAAANTARAAGTAAGEQIAKSIEADQMDPMVAADFIEENGGDATDLRRAFGSDDGVFSLLGIGSEE